MGAGKEGGKIGRNQGGFQVWGLSNLIDDGAIN